MKEQLRIRNQTFLLLPQKAVFWQEERMLIVSDLHLGKSHHFRKNGVAVPRASDYKTLNMLKGLLEIHQPEKVLLLGDLFHSYANYHVEEVRKFIMRYTSMQWILVAGNHDVMSIDDYKRLNLQYHESAYRIRDIEFTHEPLEEPSTYYNIAGHIHPGVRLRGKARQSIVLPCYYFSEFNAILPSFGDFTGNYCIEPQKEDQVYVVFDNQVMKM